MKRPTTAPVKPKPAPLPAVELTVLPTVTMSPPPPSGMITSKTKVGFFHC